MPEWTEKVIVLPVALNGPALPSSPTLSHCPSLLSSGSRAIFQFFLLAIFLPPMEGLCTQFPCLKHSFLPPFLPPISSG